MPGSKVGAGTMGSMDAPSSLNVSSPSVSSLRKVRVPKASEMIAQELRSQIVRGILEEGASLPSERELMERFGVSRPTLREAFRILESEHLVSIARGAHGGARVHLPDVAVGANYVGLLLQARGTTLADLYAVRELIEPPMARMCAESCSEEHIGLMQDCVALEKEAVDSDATLFASYANRFHHLVATGSGNTTLETVTSLLSLIVESHIAAAIRAKRSSGERRNDNRLAVRSHQKLVKLIGSRDGMAAEEHWRAYMKAAGEVMLRALGTTSVVDLFAPQDLGQPIGAGSGR